MARPLVLATLANTVGWAAHMTYMYYLAPIALRHAGADGSDAILFSLVAIAMGATVIPAGRLADRWPRRRVLRLGLALLALAYLGLLSPGLGSLVAGTLASGAGLALLVVSFQSYVADLLEGAARGAAYGKAGAASVLASAAGPFAAALVLRAIPDQGLALQVSALLFGAGGLAGMLLTYALPSAREPARTPEASGRWHHAARAAAPVALVYVFMGAGYGMTAPYFTVYFLDELALAPERWGYLLAAGTILSAIGSLLAGRLALRFSSMQVALGGMVGLFAASLLFAFPFPLLALAAGFLVRSLFATMVAPGMSLVMMARAHFARRAETHAYGSLAWNLGWAIGGAVGGTLLARWGGGVFPVGGGLALLGVAAGALLLRDARPTP